MHFPELCQLSMMNNPAAPSFFNGGSKQEYEDYRCVCVSIHNHGLSSVILIIVYL